MLKSIWSPYMAEYDHSDYEGFGELAHVSYPQIERTDSDIRVALIARFRR